jgi:hypothetical protein
MKTYSRFITQIKSHSHILDESAFSILTSEQSLAQVFDVTKESFKVAVIMTEEMKKENSDYFGYAFTVSASFLVALNIAALGHFTWTVGNRMFWHCEHIGPSGKIENIFLNSKDVPFPVEKIVLTGIEVRNSMKICASLLFETDQTFRQEYLKGIMHLSAGFGDLSFSREAFANFYRAFEYFITTRVLKKTKLTNEVKDLKEGICSLGLSDEFCDEFTSLYKVRSEQVMHAQREPKEMDMDDVLKIKVFTDYALHTYYRSQAEQWLKEKRRIDSLIE